MKLFIRKIQFLINSFDMLFIITLLNPLLFYIVIIIFYGFLFLCFYDITLCDNITLDELKFVLESRIEKYNNAFAEYTEYKDLYYQAIDRPERNEDIVKYCCNRSNSGYMTMHEYH